MELLLEMIKLLLEIILRVNFMKDDKNILNYMEFYAEIHCETFIKVILVVNMWWFGGVLWVNKKCIIGGL